MYYDSILGVGSVLLDDNNPIMIPPVNSCERTGIILKNIGPNDALLGFEDNVGSLGYLLEVNEKLELGLTGCGSLWGVSNAAQGAMIYYMEH